MPRRRSPYGDRYPPDDSPHTASESDQSEDERRYRRKDKGRRRRSASRAPPPVTITYDKDGKRTEKSEAAKDAVGPAPDVLWRLAIRRHKRDDHSTTARDNKISYVGQKPFDIKVLSDDEVGLTAVRAAKNHEPIQKPIFEVVTSVLDSRFTLKDEKRDADVRDLQISKVYHEEIKLWSEPVREALEEVIDYYPAFPPHTFEKVLEVREPYAVLMHHYPEIDRIAASGVVESRRQNDSEDDQKVLSKHMTVLRDFLKVQYESQIMPCIQALSQQVPKIRFDMMWYLFRPGEAVYVDGHEDVYACVIQSVSQHSSNITLEMWCMDTDGTKIGRISRQYTLYRFAGIRNVISLPVCPVAIWDAHDGGLRKGHIMERSTMYLKGLRARSLYAWYKGSDYTGEVVIDHLHEHSNQDNDDEPGRYPPPMFHPTPNQNKWDVFDGYFARFASYNHIYLREEDNPVALVPSPLFVDDNSFDGDYDSCDDVEREPPAGYEGPPPYQADDYTPTGSRRGSISPPPPPPPIMSAAPKIRGTTEVTEQQLLLLYPEAPAFCLNTKRWMRVRLDNIREMHASSESINNLVLDDGSQQILRAMATRQSANAPQWTADFVEGKGAAQIILLHGPPGVGKTYTVESIANWLGRPLLALTVGDLGTQETKIEQRLTKWFDLAEAWKAVLLVDEAEVFLEKRKNRDLARNGLVAAFLRRLEYFSGLLFLTTNRVSQIDDAFMSRLHVAIGYKALTASARKAIWKGFFRKLEVERPGRIVILEDAKRYVLEDEEVERIDLNGREIRNALQTAIALGEYESAGSRDVGGMPLVVVSKGHFQRVLKTSQAFHDHVVGLRREEEG